MEPKLEIAQNRQKRNENQYCGTVQNISNCDIRYCTAYKYSTKYFCLFPFQHLIVENDHDERKQENNQGLVNDEAFQKIL